MSREEASSHATSELNTNGSAPQSRASCAAALSCSPSGALTFPLLTPATPEGAVDFESPNSEDARLVASELELQPSTLQVLTGSEQSSAFMLPGA